VNIFQRLLPNGRKNPAMGRYLKNVKGFAWTLSTYDLDRFGERIDPMGWDFKRYMQNPVVEWAHRYDIPTIGKMEGLNIDDEGASRSCVLQFKRL
jgi:hypothetical protein